MANDPPPVTPKNEKHASAISQEIAASLRRIEDLAQSLHPESPAVWRAQLAAKRRKSKNITIFVVIALVLSVVAIGAVWWFA